MGTACIKEGAREARAGRGVKTSAKTGAGTDSGITGHGDSARGRAAVFESKLTACGNPSGAGRRCKDRGTGSCRGGVRMGGEGVSERRGDRGIRARAGRCGGRGTGSCRSDAGQGNEGGARGVFVQTKGNPNRILQNGLTNGSIYCMIALVQAYNGGVRRREGAADTQYGMNTTTERR